MAFFLFKVVVTAVIVAGMSTLAKHSSLFASLIISLPIISILSFIWIYVETKDVAKISGMAREIFWLVLPSLLFFVVFPALIARGLHFAWALSISCAVMSAGYALFSCLLKKFGTQF